MEWGDEEDGGDGEALRSGLTTCSYLISIVRSALMSWKQKLSLLAVALVA